MKKMTQKEFWEILDSVNITKECFGFEGILNMICGHCHNNAKDAEKRGLMGIYNADMERFEKLYNALDARGYYDECKSK